MSKLTTEQEAAVSRLTGEPVMYRGYSIRAWHGEKTGVWWFNVESPHKSRSEHNDIPSESMGEAIAAGKREVDDIIEYYRSRKQHEREVKSARMQPHGGVD